MKVLLAGATGTLGIPLVRALVAGGHEVIGLNRTLGKGEKLRALGAEPSPACSAPAPTSSSSADDPDRGSRELSAGPTQRAWQDREFP